jgi:hypothetical protein
MLRPLRIEYVGALNYITSQGDRKENIFIKEDDRLIWLEVF